MSDKLSKSEKIAAAKKKLKEFQSKQKSELPQNISNKAAETPQDVLTSSFSGTSSHSQEAASYQENDDFNPQHQTTFNPSSQTDFSAFFNNPRQGVEHQTARPYPYAQENAFQMLGDPFDFQRHQLESHQHQKLENELPSSAHQQSTPISDHIIPSEVHAMTSPSTVDTSKQISEELNKANTALSAERVKLHELNTHLTNQNVRIEELQSELHKLQHQNSTKDEMDARSLRGQLDSHVQTIGILVGEKAELTAQLTKYQSIAQSKTSEVEELQGRLNASRHRVSVLERDIGNMKSSHQKYDSTQQKLCDELEQCQEEIKKYKKIVLDAKDEISELKRSSSLKSEKIGTLEQELVKRNSELELSKLRVEQLSAGDFIQSDGGLETLSKQKLFLEQKTEELEKVVQQLSAEREQSNQQYQNYVQQLNQETSKLAHQLQEYVVDNERLSKREESLVKHVGDLERQIQQQFNKQKKNHEMESSSGEVNVLNAKCDLLEGEKTQLEMQLQSYIQQISSLQLQLQEKITSLSQLESTVERLQSETPDSKNLIASIESDKVAASRATLQNQELKSQLDEMQKAFVQVSNDKLELTDRLQSEQHLGREIKLRFDGMDSELNNVKEKLHFKDEEMIRLSHENVDLNKQILQHSQELDRLRHFEAKNSSSNVLQQQLMIANDKIKKLRSRVKELEIKDENVVEVDLIAKTDTLNEETPEDHEQAAEAHENIVDSQETDSVGSTINIATEEAMEKLQERFTRTMTEVANLTEEKLRLEHLVMQLQGETETIGEYITLYQQQRRLLKQREVEKDVQLQQIITDKEVMKDKLGQLNQLVEQLVLQKGVCETDKVLLNNFGDNNNSTEVNPLIQTNGVNLDYDKENEKITKVDGNIDSTDTASKILHLLSEIQDNNRNQNLITSVSDVHHCACCYGKLETV